MVDQDMQQENQLSQTPPEQKTREEMIFSVESKVPVGSVDKSRVGSDEDREKYPIPQANPNPFE